MRQFNPSETEKRLPARDHDAAFWSAAIGIAMSPSATREQKIAVRLAVARSVLDDLTAYTRLALPERPTEIPEDDQDLLNKLKFASSSVRATDAERDMVARFATWRDACLLAESQRARRFEVLVDVVATLAEVAKEYTAHVEERDALASFVAAEWGVRLDFARLPSLGEVRALAWSVSRDRTILPGYLRDPGDYGHDVNGRRVGSRSSGGARDLTTIGAALSKPRQMTWHDSQD